MDTITKKRLTFRDASGKIYLTEYGLNNTNLLLQTVAEIEESEINLPKAKATPIIASGLIDRLAAVPMNTRILNGDLENAQIAFGRSQIGNMYVMIH